MTPHFFAYSFYQIMTPHFFAYSFYQNEPKVNGAYSMINLTNVKDGRYVTNLDDYKSIGMYWPE